MKRARLVLLLALGAAGCSADASPPRHLLLISIDTLRADHLGCYGAERDTSPELDRLAAEGVLFEQARATSPWTLPSHGSMLTGLYPSRHGATRETRGLHRSLRTLAERLDDAGFATGAVVNVLFLAEEYGFARGFDSFEQVPEATTREGEAARITDLGLAWWRQAGREARRFLMLHYFDAHSDYGASPEYQHRFVPEPGGLSGTTEEVMDLFAGTLEASPENVARLEALYDAGILQLDAQLGRLFAALRQAGDLDDTLVIVTSDHGEEFGEHGRFSHGHSHHRELLHVPLLLRAPGAPPGRRIAAPVSLVDLAPTALSLLGLPVPAGLDGIDLSPLLRGAPAPQRALYAETGPSTRDDSLRSVRADRFKLIQGPRELRLYDVLADPYEQRDLAGERPDVAARLARLLERHAGHAGPRGERLRLGEERRQRLRALGYAAPVAPGPEADRVGAREAVAPLAPSDPSPAPR